MKKGLIIAVGILSAGTVFLLSLAALVNARGGLPAGRGGLAGIPLVGGLFKVQESREAESAPESLDDVKTPQMSFLKHTPQGTLQELVQDLTVESSRYGARLLNVDRRARELTAWEQQLASEREKLRKNSEALLNQLAQREEELNRREARLESLRIELKQAEEGNLKTAAEIYGKMEPTRAAQFFKEMYGDGQEDTVVKIVYLMRERDAAKVLGAFEDTKAIADITERLKRVTRETEQKGG